jgi:hypothetical protein
MGDRQSTTERHSALDGRPVVVIHRDLLVAEAALDASMRAEQRPDVRAIKERALRRLRFALWPGSFPVQPGERVRFVARGPRMGMTGTVLSLGGQRRSGKMQVRVQWDAEGDWRNLTSVVAQDSLDLIPSEQEEPRDN